MESLGGMQPGHITPQPPPPPHPLIMTPQPSPLNLSAAPLKPWTLNSETSTQPPRP
jgi:hypothetical protein